MSNTSPSPELLPLLVEPSSAPVEVEDADDVSLVELEGIETDVTPGPVDGPALISLPQAGAKARAARARRRITLRIALAPGRVSPLRARSCASRE
jgi:hypothetical protein